MTAIPIYNAPLKLRCGELLVSQSQIRAVGEADAFREVTSTCTGGELRGRGPDERAQNTGNNVGKSHCAAGIGDNQRRRGGVAETMPPRGQWFGAWVRTSEKAGVTPREVDGVPPRERVTPTTVQRDPGTWRSRSRGRDPDSMPGSLVRHVPWRTHDQSCYRWGVRAPSLKFPGGSAGSQGKAGPPNRTREIRPSGMTTEAVGIVDHGGTVKPPRTSKEWGLDTPPPKVGAPTIYPNLVFGVRCPAKVLGSCPELSIAHRASGPYVDPMRRILDDWRRGDDYGLLNYTSYWFPISARWNPVWVCTPARWGGCRDRGC